MRYQRCFKKGACCHFLQRRSQSQWSKLCHAVLSTLLGIRGRRLICQTRGIAISPFSALHAASAARPRPISQGMPPGPGTVPFLRLSISTALWIASSVMTKEAFLAITSDDVSWGDR